jgi:PBP1b-binding outer membrane lipoprotein LpoB
MRKIATVSMIAAAAFAVAACSKTESTNTTTEVNATDMNAMAATEGTMNDTMTNADAAMGNAMDNA